MQRRWNWYRLHSVREYVRDIIKYIADLGIGFGRIQFFKQAIRH